MKEIQETPAMEPTLSISPYEDAKERIDSVMKNLKELNIPFQRDPCVSFHGCEMTKTNNEEKTKLNDSMLHLCSTQDQRRWL
jgi:hypothetical protein